MDPKKREIRELILSELLLMENPFDKDKRINSWKLLLNELIRLKRIENYHIDINGLEVSFTIRNFTYFLDFQSDDDLRFEYRQRAIDQLLSP